MSDQSATVPHGLYEDVLALFLGTLLVSLDLALYAKATLATGGVAGLSLLALYATGWNFGLVFFAVNLPFYGLAVLRLGWAFAFRTFAAVTPLSVFARLTPSFIAIMQLNSV